MSQIRFQNNVTDLIGGIVAFLSFLISFISHPPTDFAKVSRVDFVSCYSSLLLLLLIAVLEPTTRCLEVEIQ